VSAAPYAKVVERNAALPKRIRDLKARHPFWGYRRICAYPRYGLIVNQKRIYGVMKTADLVVRPNSSSAPDARPTQPAQADLAEPVVVRYDQGHDRGLRLGLPRDRARLAHQESRRPLCRPAARAWHWLVALNRAVNRQFPDGMRDRALNLMATTGCQPTSLVFMRACAAMNIRQAFTSYSNPKGNANTEGFLRTLKEELVWLREWTSPNVFFQAFDRWIVEDNNTYLHSALGYPSPEASEAEHLGQVTPLAAAF